MSVIMDPAVYDSEDAFVAKVVTMVVLFLLSMIVGLIPMLISLKFDWFSSKGDGDLRCNNKLVMGLLAFGGGVLFSTTFMHLLHEVDENIEILQGEIIYITYMAVLFYK
jgi:solute carrier family 39 (zinc transporter), member 1/2/3